MNTFKEYIAESEETSSAIQTHEFKLTELGLARLKEKVEKLNKAAKKLNVKPIEMTIGEAKSIPIEQTEFERMMGAPVKYRTEYPATITGETPKFDGWTFIGKREPLEGSDSILAKSAPGHKVPKKYNDDHALTCDHCKKRARRNETFIVKKGKKHMEVGRSCLKDFLGHDIPASISNYIDDLVNFESDVGSWGGGQRGEPMFDPVDIVAASIADIRRRGFVSSQYSSATNEATRYKVSNHLNPPEIPKPTCGTRISAEEWFKMHNIPISAEDQEHAAEAVKWLKNHSEIGKNEFHTNIGKMLEPSVVPLKTVSYLAAGANSYLKVVGESKKREGIMSDIKRDEGIGAPGAKVSVDGVVVSAFSYQNNWGTKYVITVKTDSGHLVKMFTMSGDSGVKKGAKVKVTGKIGNVDRETYDRSPFKGIMTTTMAPRSRIVSHDEIQATDNAGGGTSYHIGDRIYFTQDNGKEGQGIITKMSYGKYEVSDRSGKFHVYITHDQIQRTY